MFDPPPRPTTLSARSQTPHPSAPYPTKSAHAAAAASAQTLEPGPPIRIFTTLRRYTSRKKRVAEDTLKKFKTLVTFSDEGYTFALTPAFRQAIARAEAVVAARGRDTSG